MAQPEKLTYLPTFNDEPTLIPVQTLSRDKTNKSWKKWTRVFLLGVGAIFLLHEFQKERDNVAPPLGVPEKVQRLWGQYSPYLPAGTYVSPPKQCKVSQVNILQRHGARYPNEEDDYDKAVEHIEKADKFRDSNLYFLRDYDYNLKEEILTPYGAMQSFESGETAYQRYKILFSEHSVPFVRAAGKPRVVSSASNWTIGFSHASNHHFTPSVDVILDESYNNTLNDDCPNASDGTKEKNAWLDEFAPPLIKRLKHNAHGAHLTAQHIHDLMALCPFETIAYERPSPFCNLFTPEEFNFLEYFGDVEKYYKRGYGNPLGPIMGVGYVNELLARLTGLPVQDKTQHNSTYPFPLDRTFYIDFTHENLMVSVYAVIGLFNITTPLDPKHMDRKREWVASEMVPFSARMVVERLSCALPEDEAMSVEKDKEEYVRIFVNDRLQPLEFCGGDADGKCTLEAFIESQGYARRSGDGDFKKCYN